jgi:hypothetical protein
MPDPEVQIVDHRDRPHARGIAGAEIAVDVILHQAGVFESALGHLGMQLRDRLVGRVTRRVLIRAGDIGLSLDTHRAVFTLMSEMEGCRKWRTLRARQLVKSDLPPLNHFCPALASLIAPNARP